MQGDLLRRLSGAAGYSLVCTPNYKKWVNMRLANMVEGTSWPDSVQGKLFVRNTTTKLP